jgi:hypothetical protein
MKKIGWHRDSIRHRNARLWGKAGEPYASKKKKIIPITKIESHTYTKHTSPEGFEFSFKPVEGSMTVEQTKDGYVAKYLVQDEDAENPDTWGDDSIFLVHFHRVFAVRRDEIITEDDARKLYSGEKIPQQEDYWIFPVDAYIHGGVSLALAGGFHGLLPQVHEEFDVSHTGMILVDKREIKSAQKAEQQAKNLLEAWNEYSRGEVYGMVRETYDKNKQQIKQDAVWGNYGYNSSLKELKKYEGD